MATAVAITFPWGRYHATPWGRHVNEGAIDWPPSPWRLLRALYATWKTRCPELPESVVLPLLGALVEPPAYRLPDFTESHTRHYMPALDYLDGVKESTDKVLDAFAVVDRVDDVVVEWPVDLSSEQRAMLSHLAVRLPYIGRSESICEARLLEDATEPSGAYYEPLPEHERGSGVESVRVLALTSPLTEEALVVRTTDVRRARLRRPPGTRWVQYRRPEPYRGGSRRAARQVASPVDTVRWAIASSVLPSVHASVAMGDILRRACMSAYGRRHAGDPSRTLSGKSAEDVPLVGHSHAHYLSLDTNGDGLLDHLVVWAPGGLDRDEVAALAALPHLRGFGHVDDFRACELGLEAVGTSATAIGELAGPARRWRSATPFAPGHHGRKHTPWPAHVASQVRAELAIRGLPVPDSVEVVAGAALAFRRHRPTKERLRDARRAAHVAITFDDPVGGPIALGALCHFGLGLFVPDD